MPPSINRDVATTGVDIAESAESPVATLPHVPALDGLRAVAVAMVFAVHTSSLGGFIGVDIFFVLSGYLITALMLNEHQRTGELGLRRFWARRLKRLIPALLTTIAVAVVLGKLFSDATTQGDLRSAVIPALLYYQNFHALSGAESLLQHTWSLAIEEQWYIVWPVAFVLLQRLGRRWLVAAVSLCALWAAIQTTRLYEPLDPRAYFGTDTRSLALLVGALTALLLSTSPNRSDKSTQRRLDALALIGGGVLIWGLATWRSGDSDHYHGGFLAVAMSTAAIILAARCPSTITSRFLSNRFLVRIGTWSYGIYLYQVFVIEFVSAEATGLTRPLLVTAQALITIAVSYVSWRWIEQPVRNAKPGLRWPWITMAVTAVLIAVTSQVVLHTAKAAQLEPDLSMYTDLAGQYSGGQRMLVVGGADAFNLNLHGGTWRDGSKSVGVAVGGRNCGASALTTQLDPEGSHLYGCGILGSIAKDIAGAYSPTTVFILMEDEDIMDRFIEGDQLPPTSRDWQDDASRQLNKLRSALPGSVRKVFILSPCAESMSLFTEDVAAAAIATATAYATRNSDTVSFVERPASTCPLRTSEVAATTWSFLEALGD